MYRHLLFQLVHDHLRDLLPRWFIRGLIHLLHHFRDEHRGVQIMVNELEVETGLVQVAHLVLGLELYHSVSHLIITIYVMLDRPAIVNFLNTLDQAVLVTVGIIIDHTLPSIDVSDLFPTIWLARVVVVNGGEEERSTNSQI